MGAMFTRTSARSRRNRRLQPGHSQQATKGDGAPRTTPPPQQAAATARQRSLEQDWVKRIDINGKATGVFADYHYVGTGDIGGATQESTVKLLEAIVTKSETVLPPPPKGPSV